MLPRFYLRFYLALLASLVVFAIAATLALHRAGGPVAHAGETLARLIQNALPPAEAAPPIQQAALAKLVDGLHGDITLLARDHQRLATVGKPLQLRADTPKHERPEPVWAIHLPDGRWLLASVPIGFGHPAHVMLLMLIALAVVVGLGAYPIMRRLAKRLERLQLGVEALGTGNLSTRVAVDGRDEVARLAASFNHAAERIETLMGAHKALLANASHELRTPLTRIRLAVGMLPADADPKRIAGLDQDIAELDGLIDEILLASRLDAMTEPGATERIDLLALAAEECARYDNVQLDGRSQWVEGDARLLRRLLRNLLENAARHGQPPTQVQLRAVDDQAEIMVWDNGPGVPEAEFEQVFAPFYRRQQARENIGAGLGLALVRQIAERHGGRACCLVRSDGLSAFMVALPLVL